MNTALNKVRLCMESAEGTEFDLKTLRELAEKHRDQLSDVCTPEALDLIEPAKQWAVLMASGLVPMNGFLDKPSREHVHAVEEEAYEEIDSRRPRAYWLAKEGEAQDEEASWRSGLDVLADEPVYLDTESYDDE
jgi:hypothetical protein